MIAAPLPSFIPAQARLGECPLWCERTQALWWTDIMGGRLSRWSAQDGAVQVHPMPSPVGSFALTDQDSVLLLASTAGVGLYDTRTRTHGPQVPVPGCGPALRPNDGRCDPQGRFIFGLYAEDEQTRSPFYRVGPGLQLQALDLPPAAIANSLAFSPDGRRLWFTDSGTQRIWSAPYAEDGHIGTPQPFATLTDGYPDGAATDAEGGLWVALWGAGVVQRFMPDGQPAERLALPVSQPSCPVFGGPGLRQLFVTTARKNLDAAQLIGQAQAGDLFRLDAPVAGLPPARYRTGAPA